MSTRLGIRKRRIPCAVVLAGLCLATSAIALAKDAPPAPAPAAPLPPVEANEPRAPAPPAYAPPSGYYAYPPPGYGYPPPGYEPPTAYPPQALMIPPGYHTHHGVYARLAFGGGGLWGSASGQSYSGTSLAFAVAGGTAITESLILYVEIIWHNMPNHIRGNGTWTATGAQTWGPGFGVAYYFMPLNLYVSGTLLYQVLDLGAVQWNGSGSPPDGEAGLGGSLMVGKEWWVSANWGLGVAAQLLYGGANGSSASGPWTAGALALMFSSTYN